MAASVFLTGATGILAGAWAPAHAITSVEELRDVDSASWAYQSLADLVEKYDVIEGYPDYTFKGNHTATRYELAAALNATIKAVGRDLARLGAEKANKSDLATLARLQEEFRNELAALNARTSALESRASAIEAKNAEQDTRLDLLEKTQLHGDFSFGVLADTTANGLSTASGISDGISAVGRFRLGLKVPVVQGADNSKVGEGDVIARLVGAFGRVAPSGAEGGQELINPISGYSALAGAASSSNEGLATGNGISTNGLSVRQNLYIESAYFKQHYKSGIPLLTDLLPGVSLFPDNDNFRTTADVYLGVIPWRNLFNRSPYKGDELNQFQNTALVNNAGALPNASAPGVAIAWHQGLGEHANLDATAAAAGIDSSDAMTGFHTTEELALNYDTSFLGQKYTKPGSLYVGSYQIFLSGNTNLQTLLPDAKNRDGEALLGFDNASGDLVSFYTGWNQEWWRGIGTSVDWFLNSTNSNNALLSALRQGTGVNASLGSDGTGRIVGVASALSAALNVPLTVFNKNLTKRAKDVIGVGYSWIQPLGLGDSGAAASTFNDADEHVFEAFYRWAVNDSVTIIPSAQAIINRFGVSDNDADFVFGLRTNYVF